MFARFSALSLTRSCSNWTLRSLNRAAFAFTLVERLFHMGKDLCHFAEQLIGHYRRLTLAKTLGVESLHLPEPLASNIQASAKLYTSAQLFYILETLLNSYNQLQRSPMPRVSLEAILLQILRSKNRIPVEVLVRRLSELEQKLGQSEPQALEVKKEPIVEPMILVPSTLLPPAENSAIVLPEAKTENQIEPGSAIQLQPAPFNPFGSENGAITEPQSPKLSERLDRAQSHPLTGAEFPSAIERPPLAEEESPPFQGKTLQKPPQPAPLPSEKASPGRYDTLLRFAAVELEGTLINERR